MNRFQGDEFTPCPGIGRGLHSLHLRHQLRHSALTSRQQTRVPSPTNKGRTSQSSGAMSQPSDPSNAPWGRRRPRQDLGESLPSIGGTSVRAEAGTG